MGIDKGVKYLTPLTDHATSSRNGCWLTLVANTRGEVNGNELFFCCNRWITCDHHISRQMPLNMSGSSRSPWLAIASLA